MYYYSIRSKRKIVHEKSCIHIRRTDAKYIRCFATLEKALACGYRLCKHCSPLYRHFSKEESQLTDFCAKNAIELYFDGKHISVYSTRSEWKILFNKEKHLVMYHKNGFKKCTATQSEVEGYHLQGDIKKDSILEYLNYILDHDYYRMLNPVHVPQKKQAPPKKGTKRYKKAQKSFKKHKRKRAIKNVLHLIDSLAMPSTQMSPIAM